MIKKQQEKLEGKDSVRKRLYRGKNQDDEGQQDEYGDNSTNDDYLTQQPSCLKAKTMYPYQLQGLNWLISLQKNNINGILADDMGLGKTLQTVSIIAYMRQFKGIKGPHLIVAPLSVLNNWQKEFSLCLPECKYILLLATEEERMKALKEIQENGADVILTSYEGVQKNIRELKQEKFQYFVLDEAHRIKNEESNLAKTLRHLNIKHKILLTGTPLQNNLHELWSLLNFIIPDLFDDSKVFDEYSKLVQNSGYNEEEKENLNKQFVKSLHQILSPFMLRRAKNDALNLPPKRIIHIYTGLSALQVDLYKKILSRKPLIVGTNQVFSNPLMQLRKVTCHPYLFEGIEDPKQPVYGEHIITASGKMVVLDKLIYKLKNDKNKKHQVLVFSQFKTVLDILEDFCYFKNYNFCRIDGDIPLEERNQQMEEFIQEDSDKFIFLLSTKAGGLGINLYSADTVILYDSDWNPQNDLQAMDRAHRIGQKNEVMVYRLITDSTVDEKMIERQQVKLKWDQHVIQQGRHIQQNKLSNKLSKKEQNDITMFGAEKIFKSEKGTISDEDIDQLLIRGEQRTQQEEEELRKKFEKEMQKIGDLSLNSINVFEQIAKLNDIDKNLVNNAQEETLKNINNLSYNGNFQKQTLSMEAYLTKKLLQENPPTIILYEHQLYNNLHSLEKILQKQSDYDHYQSILEQFKLNNIPIPELREQLVLLYIISFYYPFYCREFKQKLSGLSDEDIKFKNEYIQTGFDNWTKNEYNQFLKAIIQFGKYNYKQIASVIKGKTEQEIQSYAEVFYSRLEDEYLDNSKSILNQIQNAEKNWDKIMINCRQTFIMEGSIWSQEIQYYGERLKKLLKLLEVEYKNEQDSQQKKQKQKSDKKIKKNSTFDSATKKKELKNEENDIDNNKARNSEIKVDIQKQKQEEKNNNRARTSVIVAEGQRKQVSLTDMGFSKAQAQKRKSSVAVEIKEIQNKKDKKMGIKKRK